MNRIVTSGRSGKKLTFKQENFVLEYIANGGDMQKAYTTAYRCDPESTTTYQSAFAILKNPRVAARIQEFQKVVQERCLVTAETLVAELEEVRQIALGADTPQSAAAVSAIMSKAKLLGIDKQTLHLTGDVTLRTTLSDFYDNGDA